VYKRQPPHRHRAQSQKDDKQGQVIKAGHRSEEIDRDLEQLLDLRYIGR